MATRLPKPPAKAKATATAYARAEAAAKATPKGEPVAAGGPGAPSLPKMPQAPGEQLSRAQLKRDAAAEPVLTRDEILAGIQRRRARRKIPSPPAAAPSSRTRTAGGAS